MTSAELTAFVDTNLLLHYQFLDKIDWPTVLSAEQVIIEIAPVVIRELNKQKDENRSAKLRRRAASVLKRLHALSEQAPETQIRPGVAVHFGTQEPDLDYAVHHLNPTTQDDVLIASVLIHRRDHADQNVLVVTGDLGLKLKAPHHNIRVVSPPETLKLPEEPDPNEQRVQELEEEIRQLRRRAPALRVAFEDGSDVARFQISPLRRPTVEDIEERTRRLKEEYPRLPRQSQEPVDGVMSVERIAASVEAGFDALRGIPSAEFARYNRELEEFYARYAQFIEKEVASNQLGNRTLCLSIVLFNGGTSPAEDIDIFLHLPDGLGVYDEEGFPRAPKSPAPPAKPMSPIERLASVSRGLGYDRVSFRMPDVSPPGNVSGPEIRKSDSYDVEFHVRRLKHNFSEPLSPLFVVFDSFEDAGSFHVDYRINAGNIPQETTGQLHVVIEKGSEAGRDAPQTSRT